MGHETGRNYKSYEENLLKLDIEKEQELSENIEDLKAKITRLEENLERTERSTASVCLKDKSCKECGQTFHLPICASIS